MVGLDHFQPESVGCGSPTPQGHNLHPEDAGSPPGSRNNVVSRVSHDWADDPIVLLAVYYRTLREHSDRC